MRRLLFRDHGAFLRSDRGLTDLCAIPDICDQTLFTRFGATVLLPSPEARVLIMLMAANRPLSRDELMADEDADAVAAVVAAHAHPSEIVDRRIGAIRRKAGGVLNLLLPNDYRCGWSLRSAVDFAPGVAA